MVALVVPKIMELREYQQALKSKIEANWERGIRRQMAVMPTGSGKTVLFSALASDRVSKSKPVLVVAHRTELIEQASAKLASMTNIDPGIIKAGYSPKKSLIQVGSIQTLARRKDYPEADLIIIDEAHHAASTTYRNLILNYPNSQILGVTATPHRIDGYGFSDLFDDLLVGVTVRELISEGHLCKFKVYGGFKSLGFIKVPKGRDYTTKELEEAAKAIKPEDVVQQWMKHCSGGAKKTIVFAVNINHSKLITSQFQEIGVPSAHLDGDTPSTDRRHVLERFRRGEILVISNCGILTEGFDCPDIDLVQCARPTTSISLWLQMVGRALRPSPGKDYALIIDHTDNWKRLGLPDKERRWTLKPVPADEDNPGVRKCSHCNHVFSPMPSRVVEKTVLDLQAGKIQVISSTDCPACGLEVCWIEGVMTGGQNENEMESERLPVEFKEISPDVNLEILEQIGSIRKTGNRFRTLERKQSKRRDGLLDFVRRTTPITLDELMLSIELLQLDDTLEGILRQSLLFPLTTAKDWAFVENLMRDRPQEVKRKVWDMVPVGTRAKIKALKAQSKYACRILENATLLEPRSAV